MRRWYLDTSAALKLIFEEAESSALADAISEAKPRLLSSSLIETELRRASLRNPDLGQDVVTRFLEMITIEELSRADFRQAGLLPDLNLRSLDALHLACALRADCDAVLTYDQRMMSAAHTAGIPVLAPGT